LAESASGARVALKCLLAAAPPAAEEALLAETAVLARLEHPGIVRLIASGRAHGRPWLAMEVVDGWDGLALGERLRARPVAERLERVREVGRQVAEALAWLHAAGMVHRDVKPANVLWSDGRTVLADFGLAAAPGTTGDGFAGSVAWAAPEALLGGPAAPAADQYSFGLLLYWLLTGVRPFDEGRRAQPHAQPRTPSERDPTVPADVEAIVLRCLAPAPRDRFANMAEVSAALRLPAAASAPLLAGRQKAADRVGAALDEVGAGHGKVLCFVGPPGSGQRALGALARAAGARRGLDVVVDDDATRADLAARRAATEPLLVVTSAPVQGGESVPLAPLGMADLRRSLFAAAPATPDLAAATEALRAWSGGHHDLVEHALETGVRDGRFDLARVSEPDVTPWLDGLDFEVAAVGSALAALPVAASADEIERVAVAPAPEGLAVLAARGVAEAVGGRWLLAAEAFRAPLSASAVDPTGLAERVAAVLPPPPPRDAVLDAARAHVEAGRHAEATAALVAGVTGGEGGAPPHERRLLLAALHWYVRDAAGAAAQWTATRRETNEPRAQARAAIGLGVLHLQAGALESALDDLSAALVGADLAGDLRLAALACLDLAEVRALRNEFPEAGRMARRARDEARALRDGGLEAKACRTLAQVAIEEGRLADAEPLLADASALARAARLDDERLAAHALRAQVELDRRPGDRTAAAVALDRLFPADGFGAHDPEGFGALADALRAEALLRLGDADRAAAALDRSERATLAPLMRARVLARTAMVRRALGQEAETLRQADHLATLARRCGLVGLASVADALRGP
jgi:phage gp46-like protein